MSEFPIKPNPIADSLNRFIMGVVFGLSLIFLIVALTTIFFTMRESRKRSALQTFPKIEETPSVSLPSTPAFQPTPPPTPSSTVMAVKTQPAKSREFTIIDIAYDAPLRDSPNSEKTLVTIKAGTKVEILNKKREMSGTLSTTWYQVKHKGKTGWVSEFCTMREIIHE